VKLLVTLKLLELQMIYKNIIWTLTILLFSSCYKKRDASNLREMLNSNDIEKIIEASNYIGKNKDTNMVADLLKNSLDPRISHDIRYYGISVFKAKMSVMKDLTLMNSPKQISYKPDSLIFEFYYNVSKKRGWIKNNECISLN